MSRSSSPPTIEQRFFRLLIDDIGFDADEVQADVRFVEDLGADSLDLIEITMKAEEEFGIDIPDDDAERITTVGQAVEYLERSVGGKA